MKVIKRIAAEVMAATTRRRDTIVAVQAMAEAKLECIAGEMCNRRRWKPL